MTEGLIVVTHVRRAFFRALFKAQGAGSDRYAVAILQQIFRVWTAVDEDLVGAATQLAINDGAVHQRERAIVS